MLNLLILTGLVFLCFGLFCAALQFKALLSGKSPKHRCACSMSRSILKDYERKQKQALHAKVYDRKTVNIKDLPIVEKDP